MIKDPHSNATPATSTSASKWPQVLATLAGKKCHSVCKLTKMSQLCHRERSELRKVFWRENSNIGKSSFLQISLILDLLFWRENSNT